jgi:hypothetical protein
MSLMKFPVPVIWDRMPELEIPWIIDCGTAIISVHVVNLLHSIYTVTVVVQLHCWYPQLSVALFCYIQGVQRHYAARSKSLSSMFIFNLIRPGKAADDNELCPSSSTSRKSSASLFRLFNDTAPNVSLQGVYVRRDILPDRFNVIHITWEASLEMFTALIRHNTHRMTVFVIQRINLN